MNKSSLMLLALGTGIAMATAAGSGEPKVASADVGAIVNSHLALTDANIRLLKADSLGAPGFAGTTIYWNDRGNKQLDTHFVPGDIRRGGFLDIAWVSDGTQAGTASGLTPAQTEAAMGRAMATWDGVACSTIPLVYLGSVPFDLGFVQWALGMGGIPGAVADITEAGWLPGSFFDLLGPGGSSYILGATFTFVFVDGNGDPTDIDGNGKLDTAFAETYYNDAFPWGINTVWPVDVQSVVLHESGHALSQAHFGAAFATKNGKVHFAPLAVMNAGYIGLNQMLTGSDIAGHCSIWASWPNR